MSSEHDDHKDRADIDAATNSVPKATPPQRANPTQTIAATLTDTTAEYCRECLRSSSASMNTYIYHASYTPFSKIPQSLKGREDGVEGRTGSL